jgi:hypothetical protein
LDEFTTKTAAALEVEDELAASIAHTKALKVKRDNLYKELMLDCDFIVADVEGNRAYGPDSALYEGFGYIRKSERLRRGGKKSKANNDG